MIKNIFAPELKTQTFLQQMMMILLPQYLFRPWHHKDSASVIDHIYPNKAWEVGLLPAFYLQVEFDDHRDMQTLYPSGWKKRTAYVRVSKRLFKTKYVSSINIFCQYSRRCNTTESVRAKIAR